MVFLKSEPSRAFTTILIDNYGGARAATEHLIALGRRRIGHLAGPLDWHEARDREQAWRDTLRQAGLTPGPLRAGNVDPGERSRSIARMLEEDPTMDAVFSGNDQMALGAMHVMRARGISIPDQIAIVGFDDLEAAVTPPWTTIRQPLGELGQMAVREVLAINGDDRAARSVRSLTSRPN